MKSKTVLIACFAGVCIMTLALAAVAIAAGQMPSWWSIASLVAALAITGGLMVAELRKGKAAGNA